MIKNYLIGLCLIFLSSCSGTNDDLLNSNESNKLQSLDKLNNYNLLAKGGFRDDPIDVTPPSGIWSACICLTNPIYGFYSSYTKKYLYGKSPLASELPKSYPGLDFYGMNRFLGSADGNGPAISSWFNTVSNDLVLTTNPNEFSNQSNWQKRNMGNSYNGNEPGSYPIYRYFNSSSKTHFYTPDKNEGDGKSGFVYEGISFYLKESGPKPYRVNDGAFFQDNKTGSLYIVFEGTLRRIESLSVLNNLFAAYDPIKRKRVNVETSKVDIESYIGDRGADINSGTQLVQNTANGKIYMVDNGLYRYISTTAIFKAYYFNEDAVQHKYVRMMFTGKDITITH